MFVGTCGALLCLYGLCLPAQAPAARMLLYALLAYMPCGGAIAADIRICIACHVLRVSAALEPWMRLDLRPLAGAPWARLCEHLWGLVGEYLRLPALRETWLPGTLLHVRPVSPARLVISSD